MLDLPAEPPTQICLHSNCFSSPMFDAGTGGERTEILLAVSIVSAYSPSNCTDAGSASISESDSYERRL